ncbi:BlaI/MecI/CopY family transcriptional regulator [Streptomyces sp. NPDC001984]
MSESTTATTGLTSQYAAQVTSDLEHNAKEQERISADIAALQEQLAALQHDHAVLVNVQQVLGGVSPTSIQPAATPDSSTVPAPRKKTSGEHGAGKRTRAKKTDDTQDRAAAKNSASKKTAAGKKPAGDITAVKATRPTLVELIRSHLTEQSDPRSAAEVASALDTAHPERGIKTTVVRTTLENLVAKNQAQRTKQGSSVYYTAPNTAEQTASHAKDGQLSDQAE